MILKNNLWSNKFFFSKYKDELEKTMLEKAGLWLDEGYIFGTGGEGFERFNLAIPRSVLEDACQRLLKAFGK